MGGQTLVQVDERWSKRRCRRRRRHRHKHETGKCCLGGRLTDYLLLPAGCSGCDVESTVSQSSLEDAAAEWERGVETVSDV
jgi:hypothetical protein